MKIALAMLLIVLSASVVAVECTAVVRFDGKTDSKDAPASTVTFTLFRGMTERFVGVNETSNAMSN